MTGGYIQKKHIRTLAVLSALFLIASIYFYSREDLMLYRGLRGVICFVFLAMLLLHLKKKVNWVVTAFLLLYGAASIVSIWYENTALAEASTALNIVAFMLLIAALSAKIHFKKMTGLFAGIFIVLVVVNGYLLYTFVEMIRDYALSEFHYFLVFSGTMSLILLGFWSLLYNHAVSSKTSLIFTIFVFVLIFAEVFRAIAYYEFAYGNFSAYFSRALLILGISLLVHYELSEKKPTEILGK